MVNNFTALEFKDVSLKFGNTILFNDLSFRVQFPGVFLLLGKTGSGKSTIFSMIKGLIPYLKNCNFSGTINIFQKKINSNNFTRICNNVGLLTQSPEMLSIESTIKNDILLTLENTTKNNEQIRNDLYELRKKFPFIDINYDKAPGKLSAGQLTIFHIILMTLQDPPILLFDEPLASLDFVERKFFLSILSQLKSRKLIMIATHEIDLFLPLVNGIIVLDKEKKKITFNGLKENFFNNILEFPWISEPLNIKFRKYFEQN